MLPFSDVGELGQLERPGVVGLPVESCRRTPSRVHDGIDLSAQSLLVKATSAYGGKAGADSDAAQSDRVGLHGTEQGSALAGLGAGTVVIVICCDALCRASLARDKGD